MTNVFFQFELSWRNGNMDPNTPRTTSSQLSEPWTSSASNPGELQCFRLKPQLTFLCLIVSMLLSLANTGQPASLNTPLFIFSATWCSSGRSGGAAPMTTRRLSPCSCAQMWRPSPCQTFCFKPQDISVSFKLRCIFWNLVDGVVLFL